MISAVYLIKMPEGEDHKKLVKKIAEYAKSKRYEPSCGEALGLEKCLETDKKHVPDMKAWNKDEEVTMYGEAKTADDIENDHTRAQIQDFSNRHMTKNKKPVPFVLGVPHGSKAEAEKVVKSMTLSDQQKKNIDIQEFKI